MEELKGSRFASGIYASGRAMLREIFRETLDEIDLRRIFTGEVRVEGDVLQIADLRYELARFRRAVVIAIGKAAVPGTEVVLGQLAASNTSVRAIVVGPGDLGPTRSPVARWTGSHPAPDASAREAACRIVELLRQTSENDLVLFLISGGASAMVELPQDAGITVDETAAFYLALVNSGLSIVAMNTLRKHLSAVKGGRLAELASAATKCTLLVSDVPDGMPDVIGSGPTLPDLSTREDCWQLMRAPALHGLVPVRIRAVLESPALAETPKPGHACFRRAEACVLLSTGTMLAAAAQACRRRGFQVEIDNTCDDWEYRSAADYLLDRLRELSDQHPRVCLLSGGEVLVNAGANPGVGGRNQQFAAYCATRLESFCPAVTVLSAGTDGIDGNSPAAGAVIDATTAERARRAGLELQNAIETFDAYPLLSRIGDAIVTGPTGNNVRDLRILIAERRV